MQKPLICAASFAAIMSSASATAGVIDFNDITTPLSFASSYSSQGFTIQTASPFFLDFYRYGPGYANNADSDGGSLAFSQQPPTQAFLTRNDGGTFTLNSLLATNFFNVSTVNQPITFSFRTAAGTTTQSVVLDGLAGFETFAFNRSDLLAFGFTGPIQIDDIVFNEAIGGAVPEPDTWAILLLGFGALGTAMRQKNRQRVAARYA